MLEVDTWQGQKTTVYIPWEAQNERWLDQDLRPFLRQLEQNMFNLVRPQNPICYDNWADKRQLWLLFGGENISM